jgi:hypothetical protein
MCHCKWTLRALLDDELTQAVMRADHVDAETIECIARAVARRRADPQSPSYASRAARGSDAHILAYRPPATSY